MAGLPRWSWVSILFMLAAVSRCGALSPGDAAPAFDLPSLTDEARTSSAALFAQADWNVLVIWNRGCPRCTKIALGCPALADSLEPLGVHVTGILFGPDDPGALKDLLWDEGVVVPHLWDAEGRTAASYGLGFQHLGVFVIDRGGTVRAAYDDKIPNLIDGIVPDVRALMARRATPVPAAAPAPLAASPALPPLPAIEVDGRMRILSTEGAHPGDTGLLGEPLGSGMVLIYRWDLRLVWTLSRNFEFVPWLRVSDEGDDVLSEGAEQLSHPRGTASFRAHFGSVSGVLGAFPLRLSPMLLQRWDASDAPPIGGISGCGCAAGAVGYRQKSLEVLGPYYTFEGAEGTVTRRFARVRGWLAVPTWEREASSGLAARYRRLMEGASLDLGTSSAVDPESELFSPVGIRIGYLGLGDDRRTLVTTPPGQLPVASDEHGTTVLARVGPLHGATADGEYVAWTRHASGKGTNANGLRAGARYELPVGRTVIWGQAYRLRDDPDFAPQFRALTYFPNQEGWRVSGGIKLLPAGESMREKLGLTFFYRGVREVEAEEYPEKGRVRSHVASVTATARPVTDLLAEAHLVRVHNDGPETTNDGVAVDLRWEGLPALDPFLMIQAIREDDGVTPRRTIWQGYLSVRVLR